MFLYHSKGKDLRCLQLMSTPHEREIPKLIEHYLKNGLTYYWNDTKQVVNINIHKADRKEKLSKYFTHSNVRMPKS